MIRRSSSRRAFFHSIGWTIFAHSYQLDWIPSRPVLPLAYIPSLDAKLFYRGSPSVSASRFCFQTRSTRSSFACITGTTTIFVRVPCRRGCSFVRWFVRFFFPSAVRWLARPSYVRVRPLHDKSVFTRHTTISLLYASYRHQYRSRTSRPPSSRIATTTTGFEPNFAGSLHSRNYFHRCIHRT